MIVVQSRLHLETGEAFCRFAESNIHVAEVSSRLVTEVTSVQLTFQNAWLVARRPRRVGGYDA